MLPPAPESKPVFAERLILLTLAAVQFTHIMDFMIMMPLGPQFMRVFHISPEQFSWLLASYCIAAATTGFTAGFFMDRFDRKRSLLVLYSGFGLGTLSCALAHSYHTLLLARLAAGAFGGVAGSIVPAIVGDVIPAGRRGAAMGIIMSAFSAASCFGVPVGLFFAGHYSWHTPFFILAGLSAVVLLVASRTLPSLREHQHHAATKSDWQRMRDILQEGTHLRCFALSFVLIAVGSLIIPFLSPSMVFNAGLPENLLPLIYICGGVATIFTTNFFGRMADRHDKLHVLAWVTGAAILVVATVTSLPQVPVAVILSLTTLFMITMSGRFAPAMAMITNSVDARHRGGFMSVNSSVQQMSAGLAAVVAGLCVQTDLNGRLVGYPLVGALSIVCALATLWLAARLRAAVPHAARPAVLPVPAKTAA